MVLKACATLSIFTTVSCTFLSEGEGVELEAEVHREFLRKGCRYPASYSREGGRARRDECSGDEYDKFIEGKDWESRSDMHRI